MGVFNRFWREMMQRPPPDDPVQRQEQWTREILQIFLMVVSLTGMVVGVGILGNLFSLKSTIPLYVLEAGLLAAWWITRLGKWRWSRLAPVLLCFVFGVYYWFVYELNVSGLFFAMAIFLAGMLVDRRMRWAVLAFAILLMISTGLVLRDHVFKDYLVKLLTNSTLLLGFALVQWYYDHQLQGVLTRSQQVNQTLSNEMNLRRSIEANLLIAETQYRRLADHTNDMISEIAPDGLIRYISPSCQMALGFAPEALIGTNVVELIAPEEREIIEGDLLWAQDSRRSGIAVHSLRRADGSFCFFENVSNPLYDGEQLQGFVINSRDISERMQAEESLRESEEKFSNAFQISPDSININRLSDGMYLDVNEGFLRMTGYEAGEVLGKTSIEISIWGDPKDRVRLVAGLRKDGFVENMQARFQLKNGTRKTGLISARILVINHEPCILSFTRDITERIQAEMDLRQAHAHLEEAYRATLEGWVRALDLREHETADHSRRVVEQTLEIARQFDIPETEMEILSRGALLHDIGKIGVPDSILLKPGPLSSDEWIIMRYHPRYAYELLLQIPFLQPSIDIPFCHHEHWDGSGYPRGIAGQDIPLAARIFAVVDVYDALGSNRPYRPAWAQADVIRYLVEQKGKQFDPVVVDRFLAMISC